MVKTIYWIQHAKKNRTRKNADNDGKALYKLINTTICGKARGNLRSRIDVKLVNNEKNYLKCTSKPSYMSRKIADDNLVALRKSKIALKLNKPVYIGIYILELINVLMYKIPLWLH